MLTGVTTDPHGETVSSITYNGTNLSLVGTQDTANHARVEIWSLVAPDTGTHDVVVTMAGTGYNGVTVRVMTFTEIEQAAPVLNFSGASGTSTTASTTVTSATDDLIFGVVSSKTGTSVTPGAGQTEYWDVAADESNSSGTIETGAASVTTSRTVDNDIWAVAAGSIQAAPASPVITASQTVHMDADGQIDHIKVTMDENLDDDFSGLTMSVSGYTVTGYSTGSANDNIFYIDLTESGSADTGVNVSGNGGTTAFSTATETASLTVTIASAHTSPADTEHLSQHDDQAWQTDQVVVGSTAVVTTSVSVGYVMWLLRGGSLLTTFLSSLPAWQDFDPLAVLESFDENGDQDTDDESLELFFVSGT